MSYVIGIDIGGTKIEGVLMNSKNKVIKIIRRATQAEKGRRQVLKNIIGTINSLKIKPVKGIGIGIPGFEDDKGKMIHVPHILKFKGINLKKELKKKFKEKIVIENDANCFALAEQKMGSAKNYKNTVGVIIGTGVGTGIIIDKEIYRGSIGGAGEAGQIKLIIHEDTKTVEDLISGPAIIKRYEELSKKKIYTPRVILNKKDKVAKKVYGEVVHNTGLFLSMIINMLNPECIVLGGGVSNLPIYKDVKKVVKELTIPALEKECEIKKNLLGDYSGVLGAASLVL